MSLFAVIKDAVDGSRACVTKRGQLVTAPLDFSKFYTATTATDNTAVNVVEPKSNMQFVITAIIVSANRNVGANGTVVDIFENTTGPTNGTVNVQILQDDLPRQERIVATGLNLIVTEGSWVNVKADDTAVRANIAGYYTRAL